MKPLVTCRNSILTEILRNNGVAISTSGEEVSCGGEKKKCGKKALMLYAVTQNRDKSGCIPRSCSASCVSNRFLKNPSRVTKQLPPGSHPHTGLSGPGSGVLGHPGLSHRDRRAAALPGPPCAPSGRSRRRDPLSAGGRCPLATGANEARPGPALPCRGAGGGGAGRHAAPVGWPTAASSSQHGRRRCEGKRGRAPPRVGKEAAVAARSGTRHRQPQSIPRLPPPPVPGRLRAGGRAERERGVRATAPAVSSPVPFPPRLGPSLPPGAAPEVRRPSAVPGGRGATWRAAWD